MCAFESEYTWLELVRNGRFTRIDLVETDAVDRALARFAKLRPAIEAKA